jgi:hypothetical protein
LSGARAGHDGAELRGWSGGQQRNIEANAIPLRIERSLHQHIGGDADDRAPFLGLGWIKQSHLVANRALAGKMFAREARVHDRHRLFRV